MAKGRGLPVVLALVAALGCAREAVPGELIGRWTSDDPRYADRALEIGTERIAFVVDAGQRISFRVQGVEREESEGTLYHLYYDAPGEPERALRVRVPTPDHLRIENHSELWTRAGSTVTGG